VVKKQFKIQDRLTPEIWIHAEDYGVVMKTHWTMHKDMWMHPIAKNQPYPCPKCGAGEVHSLVLCTMEEYPWGGPSSPAHSNWIYKCKACKYQFLKEGNSIIEDFHDCGNLKW